MAEFFDQMLKKLKLSLSIPWRQTVGRQVQLHSFFTSSKCPSRFTLDMSTLSLRAKWRCCEPGPKERDRFPHLLLQCTTQRLRHLPLMSRHDYIKVFYGDAASQSRRTWRQDITSSSPLFPKQMVFFSSTFRGSTKGAGKQQGCSNPPSRNRHLKNQIL